MVVFFRAAVSDCLCLHEISFSMTRLLGRDDKESCDGRFSDRDGIRSALPEVTMLLETGWFVADYVGSQPLSPYYKGGANLS